MKNCLTDIEERPKLLLHSCCAPCSTHVINMLKDKFEVTVLYYNPNISPEKEYLKRKAEQLRYIGGLSGVEYIDSEYERESFEDLSLGLEECPEGGERCERCFGLRLNKTAALAKLGRFDYFATTLTVSPHKNSALVNRIGKHAGERFGVSYLEADFKKEDGYKKSVALAEEYKMYRQDYCGCSSSLEERNRRKAKKAKPNG